MTNAIPSGVGSVRAAILTFAAIVCFQGAVADIARAQSISTAPGSPTLPPPPPVGPPCFGANFSPDGDIWDPLTLATIPMGPPGCGLSWFGPPAPANLDGYSSGVIAPPGLPFPIPPGAVSALFSVDFPATGTTVPACIPGAVPFPPNVGTESAALPLASDSPADIYYTGGNFGGILPFAFPPMPHSQLLDGNAPGPPPFAFPPLGLVEPAPGGDDTDAFDLIPVGAVDFVGPDGVPDTMVYYSVDAATGAAAGGVSGADVIGTIAGFPFLYAPAPALGLDLVGGPGSDDIDGLVVSDPFVDGVYGPIAGGGGDYVLFSLAPGSATIGSPDTCLGLPIEAGDVLADAFLFFGIPGLLPCILIPEESMNLWPARVCGPSPFGGDNIDALELAPAFPTPTTTTTTTTTTTSTTTTTLAGLCGPMPDADGSCHLADLSGAGRSSIQIKDLADNTKDSFKWKWKKGDATVIGDFHTPTAAGFTYHVCVYDGSGGSQPLLEADIPNGGLVPLCGTKPCWKTLGTSGYKYKNKAGTPEGITGVKLKAGVAGKSSVQVKGKGSLLGPPATLGLVTDVVVQLIIDDGVTRECFKTAFPGSSGFGSVTGQTTTQFKAKGP